MLLVMSTAGLFGDVMETVTQESKGDVSSIQQTAQYQLWLLSWQRIEKFLPNLKNEIFPPPKSTHLENSKLPSESPTHTEKTTGMTSPPVQRDDQVGNSPAHIQQSGESSEFCPPPVVIQLHKPLPILSTHK